MVRPSYVLLLFIGSVLAEVAVLPLSSAFSAEADKPIAWAIVVHAGRGNAGGPPPGEVLNPREKSVRSYLDLGRRLLADGGNAVDVCEKVVQAFEDDGQFNSGKGAVATPRVDIPSMRRLWMAAI